MHFSFYGRSLRYFCSVFLLFTIILTLLFQMCKLKLAVFAIQDKSRLVLSVFVCLQKKIVGKLSTFIRKRKVEVSPLIDQESTVTKNRKSNKRQQQFRATLCSDISQLCLCKPNYSPIYRL